jgi:hypothetical protein
MKFAITDRRLEIENICHRGTGGVSGENRGLGFLPAFMDTETRIVYASRFADGRLAPVHVLDGLPEELVVSRHASGRVASVKASLVSGFVRSGRFYTRERAAHAAAQEAEAEAA